MLYLHYAFGVAVLHEDFVNRPPPKKKHKLVSCCSYFGRERCCIADASIVRLAGMQMSAYRSSLRGI